jgi:dynactin-5
LYAHSSKDTGNKVSRKSQIIGTTNIILGGKTVIQAEVIIRGDLYRTQPSSSSGEKGEKASNVAVVIGRYCFLSKGCILRPPGKIYKGFVFQMHLLPHPLQSLYWHLVF